MLKISIPVLLILTLSSCKKEEEPINLFDTNQLKGTWIEQSYKYEHFDASNIKIFEEIHDNAFIDKIDIGESTVQIFFPAGGSDQANYTLGVENGKIIITIIANNINAEKNEIIDLTDNMMIWQLTNPHGTYRENGIRKVSDHYMRTITFSR